MTPVSRAAQSGVRCIHNDLVRTVALGDDFALSGSYDLSIKVR
jgi:F-box and WD-40 domain protein 1/11